MSIKIYYRALGILLIMLGLLSSSTLPPGDKIERIRSLTREIEFNYISWTLNAVGVKLNQASLATQNYLTEEQQKEIVLEYLDVVSQIQMAESHLYQAYADPKIEDKEHLTFPIRQQLNELYLQRSQLAPLAESIFQQQVAIVIAGEQMALAEQTVPPVLFHSTPVPSALIVSPRNTIIQEANISLIADLTLDEKIELENQVAAALNVSSLVVGIGGIGVYPTMIMQTTDLNWLAEVVAHEWIHNYLSLRPLGVNYMTSSELRTMNETVASIAGKEIGHAIISHFYPEILPLPAPNLTPPEETLDIPEEPAPFDFRAEMHTTRITVDQMLAEGKIEAAEEYMELRRIFLWDNGYQIRKLNQAYFAFHGAYADTPVGAAGKDPVGAAVRSLRAKSPSLAEFINRMSWMWSYNQLERAVGETKPGY